MNFGRGKSRLQAARPGLPVIYMSGYAEPMLASRSTLPAGVNLLSKPITEHQILAAIRRELDTRRRGTRQGTVKRSV